MSRPTKTLRARPNLEPLDARVVPSATTFSEVDAPTGAFVEKLYINSNHQLMSARGNFFSTGSAVPGTAGWKAMDVKGVLDSRNNVEVFVNGMDGHLWEITHYSNGSWSGWTGFNKNLYAFDVVADGNQVVVAGIDAAHALWQTKGTVGGGWSSWLAPGGTGWRVNDVALWAEGGFHGQAPGGAVKPVDIYAVSQSHQVWWGREPQAWGVSSWSNAGGFYDHVAVSQPVIGSPLPYVQAWQGNDANPIVFGNFIKSDGHWYGWSR